MHIRKVLVVFMTAVVATLAAVAGAAWLHAVAIPVESGTPSRAEFRWVPPVTWDHLPSSARARYLAIDHWVFDQEAATGVPSPTVIAALNLVMALQGPDADMPKQIAAGYLSDARRVEYLATLVSGMDPASSDFLTRRQVLSTVNQVWSVAPRKSYRTGLLAALANYQNSNLETDPYTFAMVGDAIAVVQN